MQIELRKEYGQTDIENLVEAFAEKYTSIPKLQQTIELTKCTKPMMVDDFFIWKALSEGAKYTESTFITYAEVFNVLTARRVELLEYLEHHKPASIIEIANALNRDYKNVYDDISALEDAGLIMTQKKGRNVLIQSIVNSIIISFQ
jgi:predicted transcriptional regulator